MQACVLMNNIQQTRIQLEKTYHAMGGKELEEDSASVLNQLQSRLNLVLDELARIFATRYSLNNLVILSFTFDYFWLIIYLCLSKFRIKA